MTHSICIIGNSHLAAVRQGWPALEAKFPRTKVTFYGAPGDKLKNLTVENGILRAGSIDLAKSMRTLDMPITLDLEQFDAIILVGCQIGLFHVMDDAVVTADMPSYRGRTWWRRETRQLVSRQVKGQLVRSSLEATFGYRIVKEMSAQAAPPIYVCAQPFPATTILKPKMKRELFRRAVDTGDAPVLAEIFNDAVRSTFAGLAAVRLQPTHTITQGICTVDRYTTGSIRLANRRIEHDEADILHANELYGMAVLDDLLPQIEADLSAATPAEQPKAQPLPRTA